MLYEWRIGYLPPRGNHPGEPGTVITLDVEGKNSGGSAVVEGPLSSVVKQSLSSFGGAFGHLMSLDACTPIDLDFGLKQEFGDIVDVINGPEDYDPEIPDDAVT